MHQGLKPNEISTLLFLEKTREQFSMETQLQYWGTLQCQFCVVECNLRCNKVLSQIAKSDSSDIHLSGSNCPQQISVNSYIHGQPLTPLVTMNSWSHKEMERLIIFQWGFKFIAFFDHQGAKHGWNLCKYAERERERDKDWSMEG